MAKRCCLTGLEQEPMTYDYEGIIEWLANSLWVENYIRKKKGCNFKYLDDFIQEVWLQILKVPHEKIVSAFQIGKPRLISYIKCIINNNIISTTSPTYRNIQAFHDIHQSLTDVQWDLLDSQIEDDYVGDVEINKNRVRVENPFDKYYEADPSNI